MSSTAPPPFPHQALGVAVDLGPQGVIECLSGSGIAFMYAPR